METVKSFSPARKAEMSFPEAMKAVIIGQLITKLEWDNPNIYCLLKDGFLMIHKEDGSEHCWVINDGDLMGEDWVIVNSYGAIS